MRLFVILFSVGSLISVNEASQDDINSGPSIVAKPCNEADDAETIYQYFQSKDNANNIIDLFTNRSNEQRRSIAAVYKTKHNKDLASKLISYYSGKDDDDGNGVGKNMQELLRTPAEFLASRIEHSLKKAADKKGDKGFLSILCTSTGEQLKNISDVYPEFGKNKKTLFERLDKTVTDADSKEFLKFLVDPKGNFRSNSKADDKKTKDLLAVIPDQKKGSCNNKPLFDMFAKESFDQIKAVGILYESQKHVSAIQKIVDSCEGQLATTYVWILTFAMNSSYYFADEIDAFLSHHDDPKIESGGTRVVISRSEIDLIDIREAYFKKYNTKLGPAMDLTLSRAGSLVNGYLMSNLIKGNRK